MKAAIPTMVFSGLLATQIGYTPTPQELMPRLNNSLHRVLERRTFVCVTMAELDPNAGKLRLSNGGCPYPFVFRAATQMVEEIDLSAFPLGIRAESTYPVAEIELAHGDLVVLCSDGIIEASDSSGDLFGFDRTAETIRQMGRQNASAAQLVDHMFDAVEAFSAAGAPEDDQTMVAIRVEATADIEHIMPEN
jgi:serine phosphatase RsbU (regulator of sigma subunit)